jgi:hypothetical protein
MKIVAALICSVAFAAAGCGSGGGGSGGGGGGGGGLDPDSLEQLTISHGALTPAFDPDVLDYAVGPAPVPSSITLTPTTAVAAATVTVDGTTTASGSPSAPIALSMGLNVVTVVVTAPDGVTQRTYTVEVDRTSADLASLVASAGALDPAFHPAVTSYSVDPDGATSTTLTATTLDPTAILIIEDEVVASGATSDSFALTDLVTTLTVQVIPRGGFSKTYTVVVDRTPDALFFDDFSDASLGSWWSGTGSLHASSGSPPPSLAFALGQSVEYVGTAFSTASPLTFSFRVQRDQTWTGWKVKLFDEADPTQRWMAVEFFIQSSTIQVEWVENGAPVMTFQGPIPADDHLFHHLEIKIDEDDDVEFRYDGALKTTITDYPVTDLRFTLSHPTGTGGPSDFSRVDEVTVTSP